MITISDCEAFCEADPDRVRALARRECLGMVQAYAQAHASMMGAPVPIMPGCPTHPVEFDSGYRRAA